MKNGKQTKPQESIKLSWIPALAVSICGFSLGSWILYSHVLNGVYIGYYQSNALFNIYCAPDTFEFLNRFSGTCIIVLSAVYLLYALCFKREIDLFLKKNYRITIIVILSVVCFLVFSSCYHKFFHNDEVEHIHSAWYIKQGQIPYKDFFQHHNPLLWYLILPFLYLFGDSVNTLLAVRIFMGIVMLSIAYFTYLIAVTISKSKETGIIAVVLLFSNVIFMEKCIEIRPDVPQVLFGMVSIYLLIRFVQLKIDKDIFFSGLSAALSFLFLQKTLFLLISYAMIFAYGVIKKEFRLRSAFYFTCGFLPPFLIFLAYLQLSGSFNDYLLTNWQLNMSNLGSTEISPASLEPLIYSFNQNSIIWIVLSVAAIYLFLSKKTQWEMKIVTFIGLVQLLSLMSYSVTFKHYYLFAIPLLSISGSYFLTKILDTYNIIEANRIVLLIILILWVTPFLLINTINSNHQQLEKMNYVLSHTKETDLMYDGTNTLNLFRHDVHYFWYQLGVIPNYNKLTNNKYGDYDICGIIRLKRPKIITDFKYTFYKCGLGTLYGLTPYSHIFIRYEESNTSGL